MEYEVHGLCHLLCTPEKNSGTDQTQTPFPQHSGFRREREGTLKPSELSARLYFEGSSVLHQPMRKLLVPDLDTWGHSANTHSPTPQVSEICTHSQHLAEQLLTTVIISFIPPSSSWSMNQGFCGVPTEHRLVYKSAHMKEHPISLTSHSKAMNIMSLSMCESLALILEAFPPQGLSPEVEKQLERMKKKSPGFQKMKSRE